MYQSHLELHAVDVMDITTSNELHRDLELSEAIEEEVRLEVGRN